METITSRAIVNNLSALKKLTFVKYLPKSYVDPATLTRHSFYPVISVV